VIDVDGQSIDDDGANDFAVLKYDRTKHQWSIFRLPWDACSLSMTDSPEKEILVLNPAGMLGRGYGNFRQENIAPAGVLGPLREIRKIPGGLACCGMGRQVYVADAGGLWRVLHTAAMTARRSIMEISGFNSIHGLAPNKLVAVGVGGEIWSYSGGKWRQADSPTNVALHKVLVLNSDTAVAVGQAGVVLVLDHGEWREALTLEDESDIWDICKFNDQLYLSTADALYVAAAALDAVSPVKIRGIKSFGHLAAADGVIWSSGANDIACSTDGKKWQSVTP
jgi:hypothetical protein